MLSCVVAGLILGRGVEYSVRALGAKDQWALVGTALNDAGQVAGYYGGSVSGGAAGFVWTNGQLTVIKGDGSVKPTGLDSEGGVVVGTVALSSDDPGQGFVWTRGGGLTSLQVASGTRFEPLAIAPNGLIAGAFYEGQPWRQSGFGTWSKNSGLTSYRWLVGAMRGEIVDVHAVNSSGVVGGAAGAPDRARHVMRAKPNRIPLHNSDSVEQLPDGGAASACTTMNPQGWVGGFVTKSGTKWGAIWSPAGARVDISPSCVVGGLNSSDVVVGTAFGAKPFALIWDTENGLRDLNSMVSTPGVRLTSAVSINNSGQVLCTGFLGERPQSFLLTPLGE